MVGTSEEGVWLRTSAWSLAQSVGSTRTGEGWVTVRPVAAVNGAPGRCGAGYGSVWVR